MISKEQIDSLPQTSGVYQFLDHKYPIYIGKSINIRARIKGHLTNSKFDKKEEKLFSIADDIIWQPTVSDFEAILLESELIRKHKPKYNVLSRDDKRELYILITKEKYPKILMSRLTIAKNGIYFGPFSSSRLVQELLFEIRRVVPFCTAKKIGKSACFHSRLLLCDPCPNVISHLPDALQKEGLNKYKKNISNLKKLLKGEGNKLKLAFATQISTLSKMQKFEEAMIIRNRLKKLDILTSQKHFSTQMPEKIMDMEKIKEEFQKVLKVMPPIITSATQVKLEVQEIPFKIECYDISNLGEKNMVGGMSVFYDGKVDKSMYKKFAIKRQTKQSDFWALMEVIDRRLNHLEWGLPDLILLDGGKPQILAVANQINSNIKKYVDFPKSIYLASIAKGPDRIYLYHPNGILLASFKSDSQLFQIFVELRNEAHRFSKKFHVKKRNAEFLPS